MAQVKILKRPQGAVKCSSCQQCYDTIEPLNQHLKTSSTGRRICPKTRAPALIVCIECQRSFGSVQELGQHVQDSFLHNPELSKPSGRAVYVGRLPANIRERDVVDVLFKGFVVETTSMRAHCPHWDNFTIVNLTTVAEASRAAKQLHNKQLLGQRVAVYLQRSKEATSSQPARREARPRITGTSPAMYGMGPGKENIATTMPHAQGEPVHVHSTLPPFDPRRPAFSLVPGPTVVYNQHCPTLPFDAHIPTNYRVPHPMPQFTQPQINHHLANRPPPGFVSGGFLSMTQPPATNTSQRAPRRQRGRRQQFPPSYDGASDSCPDSQTVASVDSNTVDMSVVIDGTHDSCSHSQQPTSSLSLASGPRHSVDQTWPTLVSSDPTPQARAWTSFHEDEIDDAYQALEKHCHDAETLVLAGFNITHPVMPPISDIEAKVKCRCCRNSRQRLDRLNAESGIMSCAIARNGKHKFPGISHLTSRYHGFEHPPVHSPSTPKRRAIALDCEMAGGWNGDGLIDQLIQLTAVDYLTGEVLISTLVKPTMDIQQWRTNIHGVSPRMMSQAIREGTALNNVTHARNLIFSLMDEKTILVGHALNYDLNVLKIAHGRCVDSEVIAKKAINRSRQSGTALKKLCETLMGLGVQMMASHSCLEDSFAAREAVIYMVSHPKEVAEWAKLKQAAIDEEDAQRAAARQAKEEAKEKAAVEAEQEVVAGAPVVLTMAMPALVPIPVNESSR